MPSKLDYLSKYTSGGENEKKKKKKKKKQSKKLPAKLHDSSDDEVDHGKKNSDDDDEYGRPIGEEEDEGPVVVDSAEIGVREAPISSSGGGGTWETVPLAGGTATAAATDCAPVKRRYDSSEDDEKQPPSRQRRRYDSSDDESDHNRSPLRRRRHDSDASSDDGAQQQQRRRYESDDSTSEKRPIRTELHRRHDSESDDFDRPEPTKSSTHAGNRIRRRRRHDSDSDSSNDHRPDAAKSSTRRQRHDSDDDSDDDSRERMSSGHKAGLQGYQDFNKSEQKIQQQKHEDAQRMVDKYGMGETVYRDKHGRRTQKEDAPPPEDPAEQQRRLNQGKVQREVLEAKAQEIATLQQSTFARYQDDAYLEELRKNEIRKDDPMAQYAVKKKQKTAKGSSSKQPSRPVYKGPPPKPNRYGIRPGYRWDGIDRGNGFEDKILAQKFNAQHKEERTYRWRSADM